MKSSDLPYRYVDAHLHERRERVFLILVGIFLGMMTLLNVIGITRFIHIGPLTMAVGVLPYPLTFLCTDFISELYGRKRANAVVWVGLGLNILVIAVLWLGNALPAMAYQTDLQRLNVIGQETVYADPETRQTPLLDPRTGLPLKRVVVTGEDGTISAVSAVAAAPVTDPATGEAIIDPQTGAPVIEIVDAKTGQPVVRQEELYTRLFLSAKAVVLASMIAYLVSQLCDVWLFHFWKRLTRGKHLWLRNNGSTMVSQLVDTTAVVLITFGASIVAGEIALGAVAGLIWGTYMFKLTIAAIDTVPFYFGVKWLSGYLQIDPLAEHGPEDSPGVPAG